MFGITDRPETCRVYRVTIPLSSLQISDSYAIPAWLYESDVWTMHVFPNLVANVIFLYTTSTVSNNLLVMCDTPETLNTV